VSNMFAKFVFSDEIIKSSLPASVYSEFCSIRDRGKALTEDIANMVAESMRVWAMDNGATHYTHWFIPLTGLTAGKHEAFLSGVNKTNPIYTFSGKMLIRGEGDASSLPSGGLRATFEARGYSAWDPTSPAFLLGTTLYIPTAFYSYNGEALDQKIPLLRSMQALEAQSLRLLNLLGDKTVESVKATVGAEQEYFLIDRKYYEKRMDLIICGRTLIGSKPPKGQELGDYYYSRIRTRVMAFMEDLDKKLWSLGIPSKTRHNETAPAQNEVAIIYSTVNVALDHNQLLMQVIRPLARQHGFGCLLHEKPFEGVNGSGKHNNWSLMTDSGENLLNPGDNPSSNIKFLLFFSSVIRAVDLYGDLMFLSSSTPGNDYRLGGNEAPPTIMSLFIGEHLTGILKSISESRVFSENDRHHLFTGVSNLPFLELDDCDRNRTSPFAFTGNKFEFRMVGSSQSIGFTNTVINTAVADSLEYICEYIEKSDDIEFAAKEIIGDIFRKHSRIIFNGDNYSDEWLAEAKSRGLFSCSSTRIAIPIILADKNINLFSKYEVLSKAELYARYEIMMNNYINISLIEASTMISMVKADVFPACVRFIAEVSSCSKNISDLSLASDSITNLLKKLIHLADLIDKNLNELERSVSYVSSQPDILKKADICYEQVLKNMQTLRYFCDEAEKLIPSDSWPYPSYTDMLYKQ